MLITPVYNHAEGNWVHHALAEKQAQFHHQLMDVWAISSFDHTKITDIVWATSGGAEPAERHYYIQGPNFVASLDPSNNRFVIDIHATSVEVAISIRDYYRSLYPKIDPEADDTGVYVHFWTYGQRGPEARVRRIAVPTWEAIRPNYPLAIQPLLEKLHHVSPDSVDGGKIIVWHGKPGTGKTWALRSLAQAWRPWADLHYIVDPERFFGDKPTYMLDVLLQGNDTMYDVARMIDAEDEEGNVPPIARWKVVVLEDSGEMLAADAKERIGQSLSRLLNTADGLIGQGLRTLFLVTTNEEIGKLHEAVTRQGRCLAKIKFPDFPRSETAAWLERYGAEPVMRGMSLADLYARIGDGSTIKADEDDGVGFVRV